MKRPCRPARSRSRMARYGATRGSAGSSMRIMSKRASIHRRRARMLRQALKIVSSVVEEAVEPHPTCRNNRSSAGRGAFRPEPMLRSFARCCDRADWLSDTSSAMAPTDISRSIRWLRMSSRFSLPSTVRSCGGFGSFVGQLSGNHSTPMHHSFGCYGGDNSEVLANMIETNSTCSVSR